LILSKVRLKGDAEMNPTLQDFGIDRLSVDQRLDLIGLIWDSIIDEPENLPVPEWHIRELERRLASAEANPEAAIPWEVVKARLAERP
jgi:putative addiction module component (TIGR02574 family)